MESNPEVAQAINPPGNKKWIAAILCLCILAGGGLWYSLYYTKMPEYSLKLIGEAIEKHDIAQFNRHVDLDSTLSRGYDDLMAAMLEADQTMNKEGKSLAGGFIKLFKAPIVSVFKDGITRYVETGKWENQQAEQGAVQQRMNPDKIADRSGLKSSSVKGIAYTKKDGKTANIGLNIFEKEANKDFVLDVKMRELDDGTWQVAEITNLKEYISEIEKAKKAQISKYVEDTKPIVESHNKKLAELHAKLEASLAASDFAGAKKVIDAEIVPEWNDRVADLNKAAVPEAAKELHGLRLKVCDLGVQYFEKYGEWLTNKTPQAGAELKGINDEMADANQQVVNIVKKVNAEAN